ncbi:MAG: GntP family permease [Lachnospiraceae bacterium]|nr:GntP family permease [Lachnospiraceae bacterium]
MRNGFTHKSESGRVGWAEISACQSNVEEEKTMLPAIIHLIIAIALILVLILKCKLNAAISLIIGSIYFGIAMGLGMVATVESINAGFGGTLTSMGLTIGLGVILGQLMSRSGAAHSIAYTLVRLFPASKSLYALSLAAFILSIPVFFDVTFIILLPLGIAVAKEIKKPLHYVVGALSLGAGAAHVLVPPTPLPLAAAEYLGIDLGYMIIFGTILGLISMVLASMVLYRLYDKGWFKDEKDNNGTVTLEKTEADEIPEEKRPGFIVSLLPVILPLICIVSGTVASAVMGEGVPAFITFISNRTIAMLAGVLAAYLIALKPLTLKEIDETSMKALQSAGVVMLITGAGGAFGRVIADANIGEILCGGLMKTSASGLILVLVALAVSVVFRVAQGSGTTAGITTLSIMQPLVAAGACNPMWVALAALAGAMSFGHVNDSGFWVVTNLSGYKISGGLKTYTAAQGFMSVVVAAVAIVGSIILP